MIDPMKERIYKEAAAAVCVLCANGERVSRYKGAWVHELFKGGRTECEAGGIYELIDMAADDTPQVYARQERRVAIYRFLVSFQQDYGMVPTIREIARFTGISSTSVVAYHLREMVRLGLISRQSGISRAIRVTRPLRSDWLEGMTEAHTAQPCGHPRWALAQADEGTAYCWLCELIARVGQATVNRLADYIGGNDGNSHP